MKNLIENYKKVEQYCNQKQKKLNQVPDLYEEANLDYHQDKEYINLIINLNEQYQQCHPIIIKQRLREEFIENCQVKEEDQQGLQLQNYQLTCQQTLQYLLSILDYILKNDENQKLEFYSNPQIKIKCYQNKEKKNFETHQNNLDLNKFKSYISQFIHYLYKPIIFNSEAILIIQILLQYLQTTQQEFKNSIRQLYIQLIQYLDLEEYLKEELLYEIKDKTSNFFYKLNKCNYNICFNDNRVKDRNDNRVKDPNNNRVKDPNGPGFLPVVQKIKGYKGYGNLLIINARQDEWQNAKIYKCQYEMLLIYKKLSKASFHLFQHKMQFRYISNHQIIEYYQSYRILYHNLEQSTYNNHIDHHKNFINLYQQFLIDNQLDTSLSKTFQQLFDQGSLQINEFLKDFNQNEQQKQIQTDTEESYDQFIKESVQKLEQNLLKIDYNLPESIKEWINKNCKQLLEKRKYIKELDLDQLKIYLIRQLEMQKIEELILKLDYFNESNFKKKQQLGQGSQSIIYCCEHLITKRKFALGQPFQKYDYSQLQVNFYKIHSLIQRKQRKGLCKIYQIDSTHMWMEFAYIGNLQDYLSKSQLLHYFEFQQICYQMSLIIQQLHNQNIYHLDLKLENFLVLKKYGLNRIKLCDFGSMTDQKELEFNIDKLRLLYAPPEAKQNQKIISDKFDIWQLGNVYQSIIKNLSQKITIPKFFKNLLINNPEDRPEIKEVVNWIENDIMQNIEFSMYNKLVKVRLMNYFISYLEQSQMEIFPQQNKDFQYKGIYCKFNQIRKDDKQYFNLQFSTSKCDYGFLSNNNFIIYDILSSFNNWNQVYLFRQEQQIQKNFNKQYWSIQQKILYLHHIFQEFNHQSYFYQLNELNYQQKNDDQLQKFQYQFKQYAVELRQLLVNDNYYDNENDYDEKEKDFAIKLIIFQSFFIDLFSYLFKQNKILLEFEAIAKKVFTRKSKIFNKNSFINNIESILYKMLNLNQFLKFKLETVDTIRILGSLYLVSENSQKFYIQITKEYFKQGSDQLYLEIIKPQVTNFKKFKYSDYQLFQFDIKSNIQVFIKFIVEQTIFNYYSNSILDSPFNFIESLFIDKQNQMFTMNALYRPYRDLNDIIDLPRYLTQILNSQLVIIGSMTFDQKLQDRYKQLNNDSFILVDQEQQQIEKIFIQLLLTIFQLRKILKTQIQLDLFYFILNHWNSDLINLIFLCQNLKKNQNYIQENQINHTQKYEVINKNSKFQYYVSIENLQNSSRLFKAYISSQLLEVFICQQKQDGIVKSIQERILIDQLQSESLSEQYQNIKQDQKNQEILNYNVYLQIKSQELQLICQQFQIYSLFDWICLIKGLLNPFDVYCYYQYLKTQYGTDLILKLLIFIKCSKFFQDQQLKEFNDLILLYKQQNEYKYLKNIIDFLRNIYNDNIFIIGKNILLFRIQILNIKQSDFSFFYYKMYEDKLNNKQKNVIVYLAYFLFINEQYYKNLYYDLDDEQIYLEDKINRFQIQYDSFFQEEQLNKIFQYQFIISFLRNFYFYVRKEREIQINYIVDQYNFGIRLEQQGYQIIKRLNYLIPQRIYIIRYQEIQQQYVCCYNLGKEYLNYNNFQVIQNKNPLDYHCQSIVKLEGQIIQLEQLQKYNIQIIDQIIYKMKNIAEILFNQGYEYQIEESNIVIIIYQQNITLYPVSIKKAYDSLDDIYKRIDRFQKIIGEKLDNLKQSLIKPKD